MTPIDIPDLRPHLREALRLAAAALKESGPPFALAGSYALWVYGAPESDHDVDLVVTETDANAAAAALKSAGFTVEYPPEDWLFKAHIADHDAVLDVLYRLNGTTVTADIIDAAENRDVLAIQMPVLTPTTVVIQKLRALNEHYCDFTRLLPAVRATRERLDWQFISTQTTHNDYAAAFLYLADRLGLTKT
jgi:hypothetical protein